MLHASNVFTLWGKNGVHAFGYSSAESEPICLTNFTKFEHNNVNRWGGENLGTELWTFYCKGSVLLKNAKMPKKFKVLWLWAAITMQRLEIIQNSLPNDTSTSCLVSIFTVRMNLKSFLWAVCCVQGSYSYIFSHF